jgi:hypothetical protein
MKTMQFIFVAAVMTVSAFAADITLKDGRVLKDATVTTQTPRTVTIKHTAGLSSVDKNLLPPELQAQYPVNEAAAKEADQRAAAAKAAALEIQKNESDRVAKLREQREKSAAASEANQVNDSARVKKDTAEVKTSAASLARRYFEQKYAWSPGSTATCEVTIYDARPTEGWTGRWNVTGRAIIKRYDNNQSHSDAAPISGINIADNTTKPRHRYHSDDGDYTLESHDFEGSYSTEGTQPTLDVTLR